MVRAICAIMLAAFLVLSATAAAWAGTWTATRVRGTVIQLVGERWQEVVRGEILAEAALRTLRSGRLSVQAGTLELDIGPNSVLELDSTPARGAGSVRAYLGALTIGAVGSEAIDLRAGRLQLTRIDGHARLTVSEAATALTVLDGTVTVRESSGVATDIAAGDYLATEGGTVLVAAGGDAPSTRPIGAGTSASPNAGKGDGRGASERMSAAPAANGNGPGASSASPPGQNSGNGQGPGNNNGQGKGKGNGNGSDRGQGPAGNNGNGPGANSGQGKDAAPGSPEGEETF